MKPEIDRVKDDLDTIQKAIGLAPSFGREWIHWLKRDTWLYLLWCVPGFVLVTAELVRFEKNTRHLGLMPLQWVGLLVAAMLLGMLAIFHRTATRGDGRPAGLVREYKRINSFGWPFLVPIALYFVWGSQYQIAGQPFMAGLWLLSGSLVFVVAVLTKYWAFLGSAIPLIAFGLCQPFLQGQRGALWLGTMFIAVAVLSAVIQVWQLRAAEKQYDSH